MKKYYICPVCGYDRLFDLPRSNSGGGSYEICPSCGFQFGVTDDDKGCSYDEWRKIWTDKGMPWNSIGIEPPDGWLPENQLSNIGRNVLE